MKALSRLTFESFEFREGELVEEQSKNLFAVWDAVRSYAEKPWPQGWLLLWGTFGCGKTHLAAAAANHRISVMEQPALFVVVPDFLDYLRWTFKPNSQAEFDPYFQTVKDIEFLVLDDLGAEYSSDWVRETMYELINHRYNSELPTIITTNAEAWDLEPRIQSRILDTSFVEKWFIEAPDYRLRPNSGAEWAPEGKGNAVPSSNMVVPARRRGKLPSATRPKGQPLLRRKGTDADDGNTQNFDL